MADAAAAAAGDASLWKPPRPPEPHELVVSVVTEVEDDTCGVWTRVVARTAPLGELAAAWAKHHGVPKEAVGLGGDPDFSRSPGELLDPSETPEALGWEAHRQVCIFSVPLDPKFSGDLAAATPATSFKREAGDANAGRPAKAAKRAGAAELAKSGGGGLQSGRYKTYDGSGLPGMEDPVEYLQDNPKKAGTQGFDRYEGYKGARTFQEALSLGSAKGDLRHDWMKGYIKRLD